MCVLCICTLYSFPCFLLACVCSLYIIGSIVTHCRGMWPHLPMSYKILARTQDRPHFGLPNSIAIYWSARQNRIWSLSCFLPSAGNKYLRTSTYISLLYISIYICAEQRIVECYKRMKSAHVFLKFSYAFALDNMILVPLIIIMWNKWQIPF